MQDRLAAIDNTYHAPASVASAQTVTLRAAAQDGSGRAATASVSLVPSSVVLRGDLDGDRHLGVSDVLLLLRLLLGLDKTTAERRQAADLNQDGGLTTADAVLLLRWVLGLTPVK